jgi:hypothetical protein
VSAKVIGMEDVPNHLIQSPAVMNVFARNHQVESLEAGPFGRSSAGDRAPCAS